MMCPGLEVDNIFWTLDFFCCLFLICIAIAVVSSLLDSCDFFMLLSMRRVSL